MARTKQTKRSASASASASSASAAAAAGMSPSSPERTPLARQCLEREAVDIKEGLVVPPDDTLAGWRREDRLALAAEHEAAAKAVAEAAEYDDQSGAPTNMAAKRELARFWRAGAAAQLQHGQ